MGVFTMKLETSALRSPCMKNNRAILRLVSKNLFAGLLLTLCGYVSADVGIQGTRIIDVSVDSSLGGAYVGFDSSVGQFQSTGSASCAFPNPAASTTKHFFFIQQSDPLFADLLSASLTGLATGQPVTLRGTTSCTPNGYELLRYVALEN